MKIATFNINNVRKRLQNLLEWLRQAKPDVVCLQELKTTNAEFPAAAIRGAGYEAVWKGQKSWNGVAILGRGAAPIVTRTELPGDPADAQSRYIEAAVGGVLVHLLLQAERQPAAWPQVRLQARLDEALHPARRDPLPGWHPGRAGGRHQRGANRPRYLPDQVL